MRPLEALGPEPSRQLVGLVFDLDGTLLTDGVLTADAYRAMWALHDAGLRLIACTGRPAGWGEVLVRQWPIELVITENGAVSFTAAGGELARIDRLEAAARARRRARLEQISEQLREQFAALVLADDNALRSSDVTFDIGEHRRVSSEIVGAARRRATELGARSHLSSVHLHLTLDADDKASGTLFALARTCGVTPAAARRRYAFIGDSGNDAVCFAAFSLSFGVANVAPHLSACSVPPRYLSSEPAGAGFAQVATRLLALRGAA